MLQFTQYNIQQLKFRFRSLLKLTLILLYPLNATLSLL
jgi:hypothetical protein